MKMTTARIWRRAACVAGSLFCLAGCAERVSEPPKQPPPEVTISKPVSREVTDYFEFPGQTEAVGEVDVRARVTGYLVKVNFVDGQNVKKGDLLYEIDPRPYQAALDRAEGELARLLALADKAKADLARASGCVPRAPSARTNMSSTWPISPFIRPRFSRPRPPYATPN